ncbi:MAG TPA: arsenic resistance N-acetyltransferase ArsN2 [Woeseiaceae bacterium]|nr:arsenic resistance N-acetyltransferase ArsN2 [Gammaproteobacteria bacterium]HKJ20579.1 arsenic resistance N-acetyltransferase ArsN2 [Woeseiaceae bacterium]
MTVRIRRATHEDLSRATRMLSTAGLPITDLLAEHLAFVAVDEERVVGVIGFESYGRVGLLRSLVVAEDARVAGVGRRLVASLEAAAREQGLDELWLLTIDADRYFARLGYETRDRKDAPEAIRETAEFSGLCPGDAALMSKLLGGGQSPFREVTVTFGER